MRKARLTEHLRILTDRYSPVPARFTFGPEGRYRIRVANDLETRRRAYHLVYGVYLEKEYTTPHPSRMWLTLHDALPETATFLVERDGVALAALTVVPDSPLGLPADELYGGELAGLRARGGRLAELVSLGVNLHLREAPVLARLFNAAGFYARRVLGLSHFVITITPRHARFYRRLLCFENLGPPRVHPRVNGTVGCLEALSLDLAEELILRERGPEARGRPARTLYRDFVPRHREKELADVSRRNMRPMTERELRYFFVEQTDIFVRATPRQLAYIAERYLPYEVPWSAPLAVGGA